jgi:diguanylate cyclase (GGDEF)-like protein
MLPSAHPPRARALETRALHLKTLAQRLLPGAVLVATTILLLVVPSWREAAVGFVPAYPNAAFAAGVVLALRFRRHRVFLIVLLLAAAERMVWLTADSPVGHIMVGAASVWLPLNIGVLGWLPERHGFRIAAAWIIGLLAVESVVTVLAVQPDATPLAALLSTSLVDWNLSLVGLITFLGAISLAAVRAGARPYPIECGTLWALVAALIGFAVGAPSLASIGFAGAGLVLAVSLVEASYVIAYGDELTGLPGRRALTEALGRLAGTYTIAMVDIDHFKKFNDAYGHDVGDQLLRMVGARLGDVGGGGRAFRYGGEEFAIIFDGATVDEAVPHLETLRKRIETSGFALRGPDRPRRRPDAPRVASRPVQRVSVSVSIGAAATDGGDERPEDVLDAADGALYRAKDSGRNRLCT